jgi:hypothetical protein
MTKISDLIGVSNNIFTIGSRFLSGVKSLVFDNGFKTTLSANPTANRNISLPDLSGTLALSSRQGLVVSASRNLTASDISRFLVCDSSSPIVVTIPTSFASIDDEIEILHWGTSTVSIIADSGVAITRFGGTVHQLAGKGSVCVLRLIATDDWLLSGDFS